MTATLRDAIDYTTLGWVKPELDETLQQARQEIEAFVQNPADTSHMRFCAGYLHQVQGTLRMVELYAPAMVVEEMEQLAQALQEGAVAERDAACATLMRAAVLLPDYLERLQGGHKDIPIVLLPLLNELRAARGESGLNESVLFAPDLERPLPGGLPAPEPELAAGRSQSGAPAPLSGLEAAIAAWPEGGPPADPAALATALESLLPHLHEEPVRRMAWVALRVAQAVADGAMEASAELRRTLIGVVRELRHQLLGDGFGVPSPGAAHEPTRQLLYHVAGCQAGHPALDELREVFDLAAQAPSEAELSHARGSVSGHNRALLDTVSAAVKEDLLRIKDALDLHLRSGEASGAGLQPQVEALGRVADTLGMLGLGVARGAVQQQREAMQEIVRGDRRADENTLLDIAGSLLYVDASLDEQVARLGAGGVDVEDDPLASESRKALEVIAREAIANFADARQAFVAFVETNWEHTELAEVPRLLLEVGGALRMLDLQRPADYLTGVCRYTEVELIGRRRVPNGRQLDTLADALASLEYYLEALSEQRANRDGILDVARASLESLGYWPLPAEDAATASDGIADAGSVTAATPEQMAAGVAAFIDRPAGLSPTAEELVPVAPAAASEDATAGAAPAPTGGFEIAGEEIDDEIREVFLEEFAEEIDNLDQLLPAWRDQPENLERLRPIRRVFHTLKGSGRLVGARALGEFSWKIESLLNRVLDGSREPGPAVVAMVEQAFHVLPQLQTALQGRGVVQADLQRMQADAERIAAGDDALPQPLAAQDVRPQAEASSAPVAPPDSAELSAEAVPVPVPHEALERVPAAVDAVLLEILDAEVAGHLDTVDSWLSTARMRGGQASEALLRAVHTMNGAFAMAEVPAVTAALIPAEVYLRRTLAAARPVSDEGQAAISELSVQVRRTLDGLKAEQSSVPLCTALAERFTALCEDLPEPAPMPFTEDDGISEPAEMVDTGGAQLQVDDPTEGERLEAERLEAERLEAERLEAERLEAERLETERLEAERLEAERLEAERLEAERVEAERVEAERVETERLEAERLETERVEAERLEAERLEAERLEAERLETERLEAERLEAERLEAERLEAERAAAEEAARQRDADLLEAERVAADRLALATAETAGEDAGSDPDGGEAAGTGMVQEAVATATDDLAVSRAEAPGADELREMDGKEQYPAESAAGAGVSMAPVAEDPDQPLDLAGLDEELLDIFVEEGGDLLDHSDGLLAQLRDSPGEREHVIGLQRDLHTIKGGARMAGVMGIGDLAHVMESLLEAVVDQQRELDRDGVSLLEQGFDRLHVMVTRVGERRALAAGEPLVARFEEYVRGEPAIDTSTGAVESQVAAPAPVPELKPLSAPMGDGVLDEEDEITARAPQEQVRIRADLLDRLVNYAGEVAIYRARLEQQLGAFRLAMGEMEQTNARMRDQLRRLEIETEAQIVARYQREGDTGDASFDPLELDRFSALQQLSRALNESAADMTSLQGTLEDLTRQYETLLLQQSRVSSELQEGLMRTRMVPFDSLLPRLRRVIRQAAAETGKQAQLRLDGAQGELDRNVLERMTAPLEHMLRNAVVHGLEVPDARRRAGKDEEGTVHISVRREGSEVVLQVADDGAGLDRDAIRRRAEARGLLAPGASLSGSALDAMILEPGFTTVDDVSRLAGRGVGMDVVASEVRQLGGSFEIDSHSGRGTTFTLRLPQTLAVTQAVFVRIGETTFAVPIASVRGVGRISRERMGEAGASYSYGGEEYALHDLGRLVGQAPARAEGQLQMPLLLVGAGDVRAAVAVDHIMGNREIVVKPVGPQVASVPGIFGATIMGDGSVRVILDIPPLVRRQVALPQEVALAPVSEPEQRQVPLVMVVDDSVTMRKVTGRVLERHHFEVVTARDGVDALERLEERVPDLMLLDIEMPRMDGYELATHMKADARLRGVPIVMITSRTSEKHRERAFQIGVQRYLGKPYQENELMRNVYELLGIGQETND